MADNRDTHQQYENQDPVIAAMTSNCLRLRTIIFEMPVDIKWTSDFKSRAAFLRIRRMESLTVLHLPAGNYMQPKESI